MKKLKFNLSASAMNTFVGCPWAFQQDKILERKVISIAGASLVKAQAFHDLMSNFYIKKDFTTRNLFNNWEKIFNKKIKEYKCDDPYLKFAKMSGYTMIKNWVVMARENGWLKKAKYFGKDYAIELEFLLPIKNNRYEVNMHGFIDAVFEIDGKLYILDWKTGNYYDYYRLQGLIYSWALNKKYGYIEDAVLFVHPAKKINKIFKLKVSDNDYIEILNIVYDIFDCIDKDKFEKKINNGCKYCNYVECNNNINIPLKDYIRNNKLKVA